VNPLEIGGGDNFAWHIYGFGIGQAQVIEFGIVVGTIFVISYRFITRGKRYGRE
jgi:hypothetical protein